MNEKHILYENGDFWIYENPGKSFFEVYKSAITHSVRVASVGKSLGLDRAISEANRRAALCQQASYLQFLRP